VVAAAAAISSLALLFGSRRRDGVFEHGP